jgi:hypothetical protein
VISTRQWSLFAGIASVNVTTAAMITPQRIPLRNENFISVPFDYSTIEGRLRAGPVQRFYPKRISLRRMTFSTADYADVANAVVTPCGAEAA